MGDDRDAALRQRGLGCYSLPTRLAALIHDGCGAGGGLAEARGGALRVFHRGVGWDVSNALEEIGQRLAEAQAIYSYDRSVGGFEGWVERRLKMSRMSAYKATKAYETLENQSVIFTLSRRSCFMTCPRPSPLLSARKSCPAFGPGRKSRRWRSRPASARRG
jgi:hypothetical protein